MADQKVPITPGTGVDVDVTETTRVDGTKVERQRVVLTDDSDVDGAGQRVSGEEGHGAAHTHDAELIQVLGELSLILSDMGPASGDDPLSGSDTEKVEITDDNAALVDARRGVVLEFAAIDTASSGDQVIITGDKRKKIKVVSYVFVANAALAVRWISKPASGTSKNLSGAMSLAANGGVSATGGDPAGWLFETEQGHDLVLNLGTAVQISGHVAFFREP